MTGKRRLVAGAAIVLGILVAGLAVTGSHPRPALVRMTLVPSGSAPLPNGQKMSLSQAETAFGVHLLRPNTSEANDSQIQSVYFSKAYGDAQDTGCEAAPTVEAAIQYTSGELITYDLVKGTGCPLDSDPASEYASVAKSWNRGWDVTTINGAPALLIPASNNGPAVVDMTVDGVNIALYALDASASLSSLENDALSLS